MRWESQVLGVGCQWEQGEGFASHCWPGCGCEGVLCTRDRAEGDFTFAPEEGLAHRRWDEDWKHHAGSHRVGDN